MNRYLIVGGGFNNKGAEAMLFTLITELRAKLPDCEIYVEVDSDTLFEKENDTYDVHLIKYDRKARRHITEWHKALGDNLKTCINKVLNKRVEETELLKVLKKVDAIFDISGYSLSVQRGKFPSRRTLQTIEMAKKFNKRLVFMPQSFGPFDFPKKWRMPISYIKKMLAYADVIFCREPQGYELLKGLGLTNIVSSNDMVIQSSKPYKNVFLKEITAENIEIKERSVLVIPNMRVFERINPETFMKFYKVAIGELLAKDYNVYITYYDSCDKEVCSQIKDMFADNDKVITIMDSLNFKTFETILPKFDFAILSRFHSIVHSYKQFLPVIVLSWAIKYKELLKSVGQENFNFDCRKEINFDTLKEKINYLIENHEKERGVIEENVRAIFKTNCFDMVWKTLDTLNVKSVQENNLCISCGMCKSVCPKGCISTEFDNQRLVLSVDRENCIDCGACLKVCPSDAIKEYDLNKSVEENLLGEYKSILRAKHKDEALLANSTSGAVVTGMVKVLLESGKYDSAFLLDGYDYNTHLMTRRFVKGDDLTNTSKSRYLTVSHEDTIKYMVKNRDERIILVGTSCAITGFKNLIKMKNLDRENYLLLGLFCDKTMNYGVKKYFEQHKVSKGRKLSKLYFRTKEKSGWPGDMALVYEDGTCSDLSRGERMKVKEYFVPERCLYCLDKLNKNADISLGDNYVKDNEDKKGISSVVLRTEVGSSVWSDVEYLFEVGENYSEDLVKAQGLQNKAINLEYAKIKGLISGDVDECFIKKYKDALNKIKMGQHKGNLYKLIKSDLKRKKSAEKFKKLALKIFPFIKF